MKTSRLEAFSDGVLAIVITIMVLELKVPEGASFKALIPSLPILLTYLFSFIYVGIYWNNHHHLLHTVTKVNGSILWANLNLLFWLSLFPFVTGWMGENHFQQNLVALYGMVLLMAALAYRLLAYFVVKNEGKNSTVEKAIGNDRKGNVSIVLYILGVGASFIYPILAISIYVLVAVMWFIPDKRIENLVED